MSLLLTFRSICVWLWRAARRSVFIVRRFFLWLFPLARPLPQLFYGSQTFWGLFGLAMAFFIAGVYATGHCGATKWSFVIAWLLAAGSAWLALNFLRPWARVFWGIVMMVIMAFGLTKMYGAICPAITVTPTKITFGERGWEHESYTFSIVNNSSDDLYSIQTKFKTEGDHLPDEYEFDIPQSSRKPIVQGSNFSDMVAMNCTNEAGVPIVLFQIHHLYPGERREISFTHKVVRRSAMNSALTYFTEFPQPRINDPNTMCEHWNFPGESVKCPIQYGFPVDQNAPRREIRATVKQDGN